MTNEEIADVPAHVHRREDNWECVGRRGECVLDALDNGPGHRVGYAEKRPDGGWPHRRTQRLLDPPLEHVSHNDPVAIGAAKADLPAQRDADIFNKQYSVLLPRPPLDHRLKDKPQISDWHVLVEKTAQNFRDFLQG